MSNEFNNTKTNFNIKFFLGAILLTLLIMSPLIRARIAMDNFDKEELERKERHAREVEKNKNLAEEYKKLNKEIIDIFETYNDNYLNKTNKSSRKIFINVPDSSTEVVNNMLNNYVSHINGEVSSSETRDKYFKDPFTGNQVYNTIRQYTLLIPKDAQCAENLQEIVDEYLEYLEQKHYN